MVAVVGGGLGASRLVADDGDKAVDQPTVSSHPKPTQTPTSTPTNPAPSATHVPRPAVSSHGASPTTSSTSPSGPPSNRHVVDLGGARISLPDSVTTVHQQGANDEAVWCIGVTHAASSHCQATLETDRADPGYTINPNSIGGGFGDAGQLSCPGGTPTRFVQPKLTLQAADLTFGGRAADWRSWTFTCGAVAIQHDEQYAVDSAPGWVLYSDSSDPGTSAFLAGIAKYSVLPPRTRPLRLSDYGILRSATRHGSTVTVTIDRVIASGTAVINNNPATYTYELPTAMFDTAVDDAAPAKVGDTVSVTTNGVKVTYFHE